MSVGVSVSVNLAAPLDKSVSVLFYCSILEAEIPSYVHSSSPHYLLPIQFPNNLPVYFSNTLATTFNNLATA